jgi:hypothetical protein
VERVLELPEGGLPALERIGIGSRLWLALVVPWKVLFDGAFAARIANLRQTAALPSGRPPEPAQAGPDYTAALQLLALLQREGRFIDFLQEDVAAFSDAEIGAAARVMHDGCKRGLAGSIELSRVRPEAEGAAVTLEVGFDAALTRVTGNVVGPPPFSGRLAHHGWQVKKIRMPRLAEGHDPRIVALAEVELP